MSAKVEEVVQEAKPVESDEAYTEAISFDFTAWLEKSGAKSSTLFADIQEETNPLLINSMLKEQFFIPEL